MKLRVKLEPENPVHRDIHSYSADRSFSFPEGIGPDELRSLIRDLVQCTAAACEAAGAKDVSHVKAFLEHASGFLHAHAVSGNREITVEGRDGASARQFRLVLNAVIFGLDEGAIKKAAEQALEAVEAQYGLIRKAKP